MDASSQRLEQTYGIPQGCQGSDLSAETVAEGGRPNCVVPELEAVLGKTHRTEF